MSSKKPVSGLSDLDAVAFYDKPYLKFERLLETYHGFAPHGLRSFIAAMPVWIKEKLFMRELLKDELGKIGPGKVPLIFPEHHLSHAASAFYPSPFEEAAILTLDGVGEWATATIGMGKGKDIKILRELDFPHSLGLLYSAFTYYCGFKVNSGEYKLMGLAPYGHPEAEQTKSIYQEDRRSLGGYPRGRFDPPEHGVFQLRDRPDHVPGRKMGAAVRHSQEGARKRADAGLHEHGLCHPAGDRGCGSSACGDGPED